MGKLQKLKDIKSNAVNAKKQEKQNNLTWFMTIEPNLKQIHHTQSSKSAYGYKIKLQKMR